ncbi:metalloregulator ArsR/SmtB family transcription factor [Patescibacteria group bacterium]|nr:metalloregulator ArsR/SmtB family transcription factor [Patescibacteria group bacterium]
MLCKSKIGKLKKELTEHEEKIIAVFAALSDPSRYQMFKLLAKHEGLCTTDIARVFEVTVSAVSQQMRILEMAGLLRKLRCGQMMCCKIKKDNPLVKCLMKVLREVHKNN